MHSTLTPLDAGGVAQGGNTPLLRAAESGHTAVAELLLLHGALHVANHDGNTPLGRAAALGHVKMAKFLVRSGGAVSSGNKVGAVGDARWCVC